MAFADPGGRSIRAAGLPVQLVLKAGETVNRGDPIGYNAGWVQADASPDYPALLISGDFGVGGDTINAFYACSVEGFTGGTPGAAVYLSSTAGGYAASPSGNEQLLGYMITATRAYVSPSLPATAGSVTTSKLAAGAVTQAKTHANQRRRIVVSQRYDIDAGAASHDTVLFRPAQAATLVAGRIVYEDATTGTVATAAVRIGSSVNGEQFVASTALENTKAVGTITALAFASAAVAANVPVIMRFTCIAATQAGHAHVELEYTYDD